MMQLVHSQTNHAHFHSHLSGLLASVPSSRLSKAGGRYTPMPSSSDELDSITMAPGENSA